jgi:hypothetical protein
MGWRFRKSIKLLPGVRFNIGKTGISTSIGVKGARVTLGRGKVLSTTSLPGTGLSYSHTHDAPAREDGYARAGRRVVYAIVAAVVIYFLWFRA